MDHVFPVKARRCITSWAIGCLIVVSSVGAQSEPTSARSRAWQEAVRLTRDDLAPQAPEPAVARDEAISAEGEVHEMDPVVVTRKRPPEIKVPRETEVEAFFRTGTIAEHVGSKVTSRLWAKGDKGVMMSFSW